MEKLTMVEIPPGTIAMRDDRTGAAWVVELQRYAMASHPVTQAQFAALAGQWPSPSRAGDHPVVNVSWLDAVTFCNLLSAASGLTACYRLDPGQDDAAPIPAGTGYRLPTEAEWEYACRAGSQGARYGDLEQIAWYRDNAGEGTRPVGLKQANDWGLHDMLGNVWEWCHDQYDPAVYGSYRIFRGGGWSDTERGCLATNRRRSHPTFAIDDLGFRVVRSAGDHGAETAAG
ncbi:formylglycine-generating enzyme family protein [Duganella sp. CT11-25]|jgi:formylglycine-generating enzyme required for sulfatase activity|uniref:formylglycine-generating enzyme family protein n=1 Tax=unclassified Duganella TaxID=2636909 RepID=UPI0039B0019A